MPTRTQFLQDLANNKIENTPAWLVRKAKAEYEYLKTTREIFDQLVFSNPHWKHTNSEKLDQELSNTPSEKHCMIVDGHIHPSFDISLEGVETCHVSIGWRALVSFENFRLTFHTICRHWYPLDHQVITRTVDKFSDSLGLRNKLVPYTQGSFDFLEEGIGQGFKDNLKAVFTELTSKPEWAKYGHLWQPTPNHVSTTDIIVPKNVGWGI